jgi:hypothetical protein
MMPPSAWSSKRITSRPISEELKLMLNCVNIQRHLTGVREELKLADCPV